jgi:phospholipid/cholesterol/gamma-HCH transport system substrate-binding protein
MKHNVIETVMGFFVLAIAGFFLAFAYTSSQVDTTDGYKLTAKFARIDGLQVGSDIRLSGVAIGKVSNIKIDPETYQAVLTMDIEHRIKLPKDSSAEILSSGLLGSKYIALVPGGDEAFLAAGDEVSFTQASISLEAMIGQVIFSKKDKTEEPKK